MKTCPNCRCVYGDEYAGTCSECGAPMGGVHGNTQSGLQFAYARQIADGAREGDQEAALKQGRYSGLRIADPLMEVARAGAYLLEKAAGKDVSAWED